MHRARSILRPLLVSCVLAYAAPAEGDAPDAYERAMQRAREAEASGDYAGAARALRAVVDSYKQDYAIALELGWAFERAGDPALAERAYRVAHARAPASTDARLALERFDRVERPAVDAFGGFDAYAFPGDPTKSSGLGLVTGVTGAPGGGWTLGATYRYGAFTPPAGAPTPAFVQHEGYVRAGFERRAAAVEVQAAVVSDGSGLLGISEHVGASVRWSPAGDLLLDGALSLYRDVTVPRVALAWSIPVAGPLRLTPGVAAQDVNGQALANASLALLVRAPWAAAWAGVKAGDEVRPAYLPVQVVYDVPSRVRWGAWAGARVRAGGPLSLFATYSFDRMQRTDALQPVNSDAHALVLGASVAF